MGFAVMTLTPAAAERVKTIVKTSDNAAGIRVSIKKGGCAGMEYAIDMATPLYFANIVLIVINHPVGHNFRQIDRR